MLKKLKERLRTLIEQGQAILKPAQEPERDLTGEEQEKLAKITKEMGELRAQIDQIEEFEAESKRWEGSPTEPIKPELEGASGSGQEKKRSETGGFNNLGEFVRSCRWPREYPFPDEYREMSMGTGASGGFLVPPQFRTEVLQLEPAEAIMRPRAQVIPAGDPPDASIFMPALDYSAGMFGGVEVVWIAEGGTKPETEPSMVEISLEPKEVAAYVTLSDKLLRNAAAAGPVIRDLLRRAVAATEDLAFIAGNGVGKPMGFINCPGRIEVTRNTAADVKFVDIAAMRAGLIAEAWERAVWPINQSAMPKVISLQDAAGNSIFIRGDATKNVPDILFGFPVRWNGRCPALGSRGDVNLIDPKIYLIKDGSGPYLAASEHVYFRNNKTVIKITWNVDGQGWLNSPVTLDDGSTQVSAFVVLK